uniref:Uncharacterized protein n=1 Tax=Vespula pensylvanica TaxID=30213 RepID=A0A834UG34_VESPE|nr:hypothetical protein H0235_000139 [Vespula pensylvanica]
MSGARQRTVVINNAPLIRKDNAKRVRVKRQKLFGFRDDDENSKQYNASMGQWYRARNKLHLSKFPGADPPTL